MNKADKSQKAETAFKLFDKNRDGYITREEFTKVFYSHFIIGMLTHQGMFKNIIYRFPKS